MIPEKSVRDVEGVITKLGDKFTPFFYLFIAVPQYEELVKSVYSWLYSEFKDTKHPNEMLDVIRNLQCCANHFNEIKDHLAEIMRALRHTEMGQKINENKLAVEALLTKINKDLRSEE